MNTYITAFWQRSPRPSAIPVVFYLLHTGEHDTDFLMRWLAQYDLQGQLSQQTDLDCLNIFVQQHYKIEVYELCPFPIHPPRRPLPPFKDEPPVK